MIKTLIVQGMKGEKETGKVQDALNQVSGISATVTMNHGGEAVVKLTRDISNDTLKSTVSDAGCSVVQIYE